MTRFYMHYKPTKSTAEVKSKQDVLRFVLSKGIYNLDYLDDFEDF